MMNEETAQLGSNEPEFAGRALLRLLAGIALGLLSLPLFYLGMNLVVIVLLIVLLIIAGLNGYRAWMILLIASMVSGLRYAVGDLTIRPDHIALIFMMVGWLPALLMGKMHLNRVPMLLPIMLYIGANFLSSALFAPERGESYQGSALLIVYVFMYIMTVTVLQEYPHKYKRAVKALLVIGLIQGAYALLAFALNPTGVRLGGVTAGHIEETLSLQGGFEEPNFLGAFEALVGVIFLALLTARTPQIKKGVAIAAMLFATTIMVLTFTRAAWLGFMAGALIILFMQKPPRNIFNPKAMAVVGVMAVVVGVAALPFANALTSGKVNDRVGELLDFSSGSGEGRVQVQKVAMERWQESPLLGRGTLSLPEEAARPSPAGAWLYSSMIQALHDTGIAGLVLLLWIQLGMLLTIVRGYRVTKDPFLRSALAGFAAGSVILFIASQASSFIWLGFPWIFSGLAVAIAVTELNKSRDSDRPVSL